MLSKIKETAISIGPIAIIILIFNWTIAPIGQGMTLTFIICALFTILGLSLFLLGADIGIIPIGEKAGSSLTSKKNLPLLLSVSFFVGFIITIAEPDVQVLTSQICDVDKNVNPTILLVMIAAGIGFFVSFGLLRTVLQLPVKIVFAVLYTLIFIVAFLAPSEYFAIAFDASGATTGPMTVPFILAIGMGVAAVKVNKGNENKSDNFGLTGIASVGPIMAVLIMGIILSGNQSSTAEATQTTANATTVIETSSLGNLKLFFSGFPHFFEEVARALLPLVGMFIFFLVFFFKMTKRQIIRISVGLVYAYFGLVLFLAGINGGFIPAGTTIGTSLVASENTWLLVLFGVIFGGIVVCAEPAVWVLTKQVEEISGGAIKRPVLLLALSSGVCIAVGLAMIRVIFGFSIAFLLVPIYSIAMILMIFCPKLFTVIAFDSGGVASGPMTSSFILAYTLGASTALGGNPLTDAFGVIALVASAPLIAIQILGLVFAKKSAKLQKKDSL